MCSAVAFHSGLMLKWKKTIILWSIHASIPRIESEVNIFANVLRNNNFSSIEMKIQTTKHTSGQTFVFF